MQNTYGVQAGRESAWQSDRRVHNATPSIIQGVQVPPRCLSAFCTTTGESIATQSSRDRNEVRNIDKRRQLSGGGWVDGWMDGWVPQPSSEPTRVNPRKPQTQIRGGGGRRRGDLLHFQCVGSVRRDWVVFLMPENWYGGLGRAGWEVRAWEGRDSDGWRGWLLGFNMVVIVVVVGVWAWNMAVNRCFVTIS